MIEIKGVPSDKAPTMPDWVRDSLLGVCLPCAYHMVVPCPKKESGERKVYIVPLVWVLEILFSLNFKAFDWWVENVVVHPGQVLAFEDEYVHEIDPTPRRDRHGFVPRMASSAELN